MKEGGKVSEAADELGQAAVKDGKKVDGNKLGTIIMTHTVAVVVTAMGAGVLPGVGALIASGIMAAAIVVMYVRVGKCLQLNIEKDLEKAAIVSAVVTASLVGLLRGLSQV